MAELQEKSLTSRSAFACNVYSMVPYVGVVFLPLAFVIGGLDYLRAFKSGDSKDLRFGLGSLALTLFLTAVQVFLWSLFYFVPTSGL